MSWTEEDMINWKKSLEIDKDKKYTIDDLVVRERPDGKAFTMEQVTQDAKRIAHIQGQLNNTMSVTDFKAKTAEANTNKFSLGEFASVISSNERKKATGELTAYPDGKTWSVAYGNLVDNSKNDYTMSIVDLIDRSTGAGRALTARHVLDDLNKFDETQTSNFQKLDSKARIYFADSKYVAGDTPASDRLLRNLGENDIEGEVALINEIGDFDPATGLKPMRQEKQVAELAKLNRYKDYRMLYRPISGNSGVMMPGLYKFGEEPEGATVSFGGALIKKSSTPVALGLTTINTPIAKINFKLPSSKGLKEPFPVSKNAIPSTVLSGKKIDTKTVSFMPAITTSVLGGLSSIVQDSYRKNSLLGSGTKMYDSIRGVRSTSQQLQIGLESSLMKENAKITANINKLASAKSDEEAARYIGMFNKNLSNTDSIRAKALSAKDRELKTVSSLQLSQKKSEDKGRSDFGDNLIKSVVAGQSRFKTDEARVEMKNRQNLLLQSKNKFDIADFFTKKYTR